MVLVAVVGAALLLLTSAWGKDGGTRVISGGTTGRGPAVGDAPASPARAVNIGSGVDRAVGGSGAGLANSQSAAATAAGDVLVDPNVAESFEHVPGHAESSGSHTVQDDRPNGGGLVITNSGSAVADSGDNSRAKSGDGDPTGIETGSVSAEGNRSSTHVGP